MDIYKKILNYLSKNDNGDYIDITQLDDNFTYLNEKARELSTSGYIKIGSPGFYAVGFRNGSKTTYGNSEKLKTLKAKILLAGHDYLKNISKDITVKPQVTKSKKIEALNTLIYEVRTWKGFERSKVDNFIIRAKQIIEYVDGSDSEYLSEIDVFNTTKSTDNFVITDWDEQLITVLETLKNKIDFEELGIEESNQDLVVYVSQTRINQLKDIQSTNFDLIKLIQLCKELNDAYRLENYYTVGIIVRTIINHVPPIFNKDSFASVVSQYKSEGNTISFKGNMEHLENTSRKIGDSFAHSITRKKENLPTSVQVDFRQGLDVLLGEIVRILK